MKYENFEDVPVWQDGIELTVQIFDVTQDKAFRFKGDIANQIQRAGLSVPNNIAEGFERGTTAELITFLYYAKGSVGEVRSICHVIERLEGFEHLKSQVEDIRSRARSVSKQLAGWALSLQETDIKGTRHLTAQSKGAWAQKHRGEAFLDKLKQDHEQRLSRLKKERGCSET